MQASQPARAPLTPGIVFENLQAHQRTAALKAAIELDIFRAVGEGPGDVSSIARHAAASERGIRILCDFLVICGLLEKESGCYRHTPASAAFLDPTLAGVPGLHRALSRPCRTCARPTSTWPTSCATAVPCCPAPERWNPRIRCGWSLRRPWRR